MALEDFAHATHAQKRVNLVGLVEFGSDLNRCGLGDDFGAVVVHVVLAD